MVINWMLLPKSLTLEWVKQRQRDDETSHRMALFVTGCSYILVSFSCCLALLGRADNFPNPWATQYLPMNFVMKVSQTLFPFLQFPSTEIYTEENAAAGSSNQKGLEIWDWFYCLSGELMTMIIFLGFRDRNLEAHGSWQQNILIITCGHLYKGLMRSKLSRPLSQDSIQDRRSSRTAGQSGCFCWPWLVY